MPNILVLGATGYIGQAVLRALSTSGQHSLYGLARTPAKASLLRRLEVIPVLGSISDSAAYLSLLSSAPIDIVIDAAGGASDSLVILEGLKKEATARQARAANAGVKCCKLGFIYTSGIWVHGSSLTTKVNDLSPVGVPIAPSPTPQLVAWRPALEQEILSASGFFDVMILRPALVYGRAGNIWTCYFEQLRQAAAAAEYRDVGAGTLDLELKADVDSRPPLVHVDDVASGFAAAVDKLALLAGAGVYPVFDLVTSQESMRDVLESGARGLGYGGKVKLVGAGEDLFLKAMNVSVNGSSARAVSLLGWEPRRMGFVKDAEVYVQAWLAAQE